MNRPRTVTGTSTQSSRGSEWPTTAATPSETLAITSSVGRRSAEWRKRPMAATGFPSPSAIRRRGGREGLRLGGGVQLRRELPERLPEGACVVRKAVRRAEGTHGGRDTAVVVARHRREEVVLDVKVEPPGEPGHEGARGHDVLGDLGHRPRERSVESRADRHVE